MEMKIQFAGNKKVTAQFSGFTVLTDQSKEVGGNSSAPGPFDYFLASIGTCAGVFIQSFCQKRGISTNGIELIQRMHWDHGKHLVTKITIEIHIPEAFPDQYRSSLIHATNLCTVKRHLRSPPEFEVITVVDHAERQVA